MGRGSGIGSGHLPPRHRSGAPRPSPCPEPAEDCAAALTRGRGARGDMGGARAAGVRARQRPHSSLGARPTASPLRRPLLGLTRLGKPTDLRHGEGGRVQASPRRGTRGLYLACSRRPRPAAWCRTAPSVTPKPSAGGWRAFPCSELPWCALHAAPAVSLPSARPSAGYEPPRFRALR